MIIVGVVLILLVGVGVPGVIVWWRLKCRKNRGPQIAVKYESKPPELIAYGGSAVSSDSLRRSSTTSVDGSRGQVGNTRVLNEMGQLIEMTEEILEKQGQTNLILNAIRKYL